MKKIVPILALCYSILVFALSLAGIITISIATKVSQISIFAIPTVIFGAVISMISTAFIYILRNDKLCRIAFFINVAALVLSVASIFVWLCAL